MERINRTREQGWRNVLGSGGSGDVKVGSRCRNVDVVCSSHHWLSGMIFTERTALGFIS